MGQESAREAARGRQRHVPALKKTFLRQHHVFVEEFCQLRSQYVIFMTERPKPFGALVFRHGERLVQVRT